VIYRGFMEHGIGHRAQSSFSSTRAPFEARSTARLCSGKAMNAAGLSITGPSFERSMPMPLSRHHRSPRMSRSFSSMTVCKIAEVEIGANHCSSRSRAAISRAAVAIFKFKTGPIEVFCGNHVTRLPMYAKRKYAARTSTACGAA
jgi:hypothetical protein